MTRPPLSLDAVQAQIAQEFGQMRRERDELASTPQGRAVLQEHADRLAALPRPRTPEPLA